MRKAGIKSRRTSPGVGFLASPNIGPHYWFSSVIGTGVWYQCEVRLALRVGFVLHGAPRCGNPHRFQLSVISAVRALC